MDGTTEVFREHMAFHRLAGARWVTCDPFLNMQVDDLTNEELVPQVSG